jgi:hypothetical protein
LLRKTSVSMLQNFFPSSLKLRQNNLDRLSLESFNWLV